MRAGTTERSRSPYQPVQDKNRTPRREGVSSTRAAQPLEPMLCPICLLPSSRVAPGQACDRCGWEAPPLPTYTLPQPGRETEAPWTMALELPSGDTYRVTIPGSYDPKALAKGWRKVYQPEAPQFDATRYAIETLEAAANVLAGAARTTAEEAERAYMLAAVATLRATASRWRSTAAPDSPDQE